MDAVLQLLDGGADGDEADTFHMTPIHYASQNGYVELVKVLVERGVNVNVENKVRLLCPLPIAHPVLKLMSFVLATPPALPD